MNKKQKNKEIIKPRVLKGFRDFLGEEARKREYVAEIIKQVFQLWGFEPLETPALEYLSVFSGNIGEDEKLFYKFTDQGGRQVALRYDQTVPACRVIAQYPEKITLPYKRYQIQPVWRAEKPQAGRYREFLQCDADIFGLSNSEADAEMIALTIDVFKKLGFKKPLALINDRDLFKNIPYKAIVAIDKLEKIGEKGVIQELIKKGYQEDKAKELLNEVKTNKPNSNLKTIFRYLDSYGFKENYQFSPTLARSFSYSTGTIWEIIVPEFSAGSLAGCERFDSLVSRFSKKKVAGVGFAIGFDRTILAMEELGLLPQLKTSTQAMVAVLGQESLGWALKISRQIRDLGINLETYSDPAEKLEKQLKYADKKSIPYVLVIGPKEIENKKIGFKDMEKNKQESLDLEEIIKRLKKIF